MKKILEKKLRPSVPILCCIAIICLSLTGCSDGEGTQHPYLRRAEAAREKGDYSKAEEFYERFLLKYPASKRGLLAAGAFYSENMRNNEKAISCYLRYLRLTDSEQVRKYLEGVRQADFNAKQKIYADGGRDGRLDALAGKLRNAEAENNVLRRMISRQNRVIAELNAEITKISKLADAMNEEKEKKEKKEKKEAKYPIKQQGESIENENENENEQ